MTVFALHPLPLGFLDSLGGPELIVILVVVLIFFGGEKMPEFARGLGKAMKEFKKAASEVETEFKRAMDEPPPPKTATTVKPLPAPGSLPFGQPNPPKAEPLEAPARPAEPPADPGIEA